MLKTIHLFERVHSYGDRVVTKSGFDMGSHKNPKNTVR